MPELRRDPVTGAWVILSPERKVRPQYYAPNGDLALSSQDCPFCENNEAMTPPEVYSLREGAAANQPGWRLRVVPNKYPALRVEGLLDKRADGFYDKMNGIGAHEVVIETPQHNTGLAEMSLEAVTDLLVTFKRRILDLKRDVRFKYIQVFKNQGAMAGATIPHPHSQIVAMPIVPEAVDTRMKRAHDHFKQKERCIHCDIIHHETAYRKRVLYDNSDYMALIPFASPFPFGLNIYPRQHAASFESLDDYMFPALAQILKDSTERMDLGLDNPSYNLILHNAPFDRDASQYFHWHLELIPILAGTGGFEIGTGSYINSVPPEEAIKILKDTV